MNARLNRYSPMSSSANGWETVEDSELQQRLGLYQVFLKLYEHHRGLLDEILDLETSGSKALGRVTLPYIQGVISDQQVYLVTNLLKGKTQILYQPQQVWSIGRDSSQVGMAVHDKRLSRCHAAIHYVQGQGFYFTDLNSSNGSFVNGERVHQSHPLQDGDRLRLGSLTFAFFICQLSQPFRQTLQPIDAKIAAQLADVEKRSDAAIAPALLDEDTSQNNPSLAVPDETLLFLRRHSCEDV